MYADKITDSMQYAINETSRRRFIQNKYNEEHGIIPQTISKAIREVISNVDTQKGTKRSQKLTKKDYAY